MGDRGADWTLDDAVLESYIEGFYGQGRYEAKYWFVGMEFGGGTSVAEIVSRIHGWHDRGGRELEDVVAPGEPGWPPWFVPHPPLQPTWAKLIRVALTAEGLSPTTEDIRSYQEKCLGRAGGLDCLLELLPLPSPGLNRWQFYPEYSRLPYLRDRATYANHVAPLRIAHLRERIREHGPCTVIFYGSGYEYWWRQIAGVDFAPSDLDKVVVARDGATLFVVMRHPAARGLASSYFNAVGRLIADAQQS